MKYISKQRNIQQNSTVETMCCSDRIYRWLKSLAKFFEKKSINCNITVIDIYGKILQVNFPLTVVSGYE